MRIVVNERKVKALLEFHDLAILFAGRGWQSELYRGVIDAGRKTKTRVQKAVAVQMALKAGNYQRYVVKNTRGAQVKAELAYDIFAVAKGTDVDRYKGLRVRERNPNDPKLRRGRGFVERGLVNSSVWNVSRRFKRSFGFLGHPYAMRPLSEGASTKAPPMLWTYGRKPDQKRGKRGRFQKTGKKYGKIRLLFGPALRMEIPKDKSLETFLAVGPRELQIQVEKRIAKLMRF